MTTLPFWPLASRPPAGNSVVAAAYSPVWSSVSAPGALVLTDSIPLSADCLRSYVSLVAMTCPLVATRLKWYLPPDPFFRTNLPDMLPPCWELELAMIMCPGDRKLSIRPVRLTGRAAGGHHGRVSDRAM